MKKRLRQKKNVRFENVNGTNALSKMNVAIVSAMTVVNRMGLVVW